MNKLKSYFLSLTIALLQPLGIGLGIWQLVSEGVSLEACGLILAWLAPMLFFTTLLVLKRGRTTRDEWMFTLPALTGLILTLWGEISSTGLPGWMSAMAAFSLLTWWGYLRWYSTLGRVPGTLLREGAPLPDFELIDLEGGRVSSAQFRAKPGLFLFYRGNWCPFCMAQVREIADQYRNLAARGVQVYLISGQSGKHTRNLAEKFDIPIAFLRDEGLKAARKLGLFHEAGVPVMMQPLGYESDTVYTTVMVTDDKGIVRFLDQTNNYRLRPEPQQFMEIISNL